MYRKIHLENILKNSFCRNYSNKYTATIFLPKTTFPQRLKGKKISENSGNVTEKAEFKKLYSWQRANLPGEEFILHDGPPYANGVPHMGHAINKILKDIINRFHILQKRKVNFVPGWDCHGLPIEMKTISKLKPEENNPLGIRNKAREYTKNTIEEQSKIFQSWGLVGDWEKPYLTFSNKHIQNELRQFYKLYKKKLIYRDFKPVYWSPSSRTALAEAELEYNDKHKSIAIYVKFKLNKIPNTFKKYVSNSNCYVIIWTTTPWTLPSNQAICYNPEHSYSLVQIENDPNYYIIATELRENLCKQFQRSINIIASFSGTDLEGTTYDFPFKQNVELPLLSGDHASLAKGTGLVHTAPAHGPEDFILALNHKIPVKCLVDELGCFTKEAGKFEGLQVLSDGNTAVLKELQNDILCTEEYIHSYPYDWRTKKPIILRASKQWFIDTDAIKDQAIELLDEVKIFPEKHSTTYKSILVNQLKKRPFWCISRQRVWGVPIPVFYNKHSGEPLISESSIENLCELFDKHGTDIWWKSQVTDLINKQTLHEFNLSVEEIKKGQDILDIWFDSGLSWSSVLGDEKIADLYIEGIDQFTGWFQSSLLMSVALRGCAPYKNLYVHGFAVDEKGHKMSKSVGNVVDPQDIIHGNKKQQALGIDTLRWWVACHASQSSTSFISQNILQSTSDEVQKIRNTLRFSVGALSDFDVSQPNLQFKNIDKYLLHLLHEHSKEVEDLYKNYNFNKICINIVNFVTNPVSALYYNVIKDRLYCNPIDDSSRRAAQFVLKNILYVLSKSIAPIMPHLIEEAFLHLKDTDSFFKTEFVISDEYKRPELEKIFETVLEIRKNINKQNSHKIEAKIDLNVSSDIFRILQIFSQDDYTELIEIFQISELNLKECVSLPPGEFSIEISKTTLSNCPRCRRYNSTKKDDLCNRCFSVLQNDDKKVVSL